MTSPPLASASTVRCTSLGLFILDKFEYRSQAKEGNTLLAPPTYQLGGGGTYAILGARMWLPAHEVALVVDRGTDWQMDVQKQLDTFGQMWYWREKDGLTTTALNLYTGEHRDFQYLTPRTRLEPIDLPPSLRSPDKTTHLHFICSPTRALVIYSQLSTLSPRWSPSLVYEPIPSACEPAELDPLRQLLPHLAIFSPNHEEAASFFSISAESINAQGRFGVEELARRFLEEGTGGAVVIRSGPLGAYAISKGQRKGVWVDAWYNYGDEAVKDVTGAGNSFLGGLMAGIVIDPGNLLAAMQMGSVSASYTIEQFGLPAMSASASGEERWNGEDPASRLAALQSRSPPLA